MISMRMREMVLDEFYNMYIIVYLVVNNYQLQI